MGSGEMMEGRSVREKGQDGVVRFSTAAVSVRRLESVWLIGLASPKEEIWLSVVANFVLRHRRVCACLCVSCADYLRCSGRPRPISISSKDSKFQTGPVRYCWLGLKTNIASFHCSDRGRQSAFDALPSQWRQSRWSLPYHVPWLGSHSQASI